MIVGHDAAGGFHAGRPGDDCRLAGTVGRQVDEAGGGVLPVGGGDAAAGGTARVRVADQAAELAQTMGVKIYTIGVGTKGEAPIPIADPFTGRKVLRMVPVHIDEETLTKVADLTGGKYYRATDTSSLEKIYAEIDVLEKTKVEAQHYVDYRELAVQPFRLGSLSLPPILLLAFILLAARWLLQETWLRELT